MHLSYPIHTQSKIWIRHGIFQKGGKQNHARGILWARYHLRDKKEAKIYAFGGQFLIDERGDEQWWEEGRRNKALPINLG